MSGFRLIDLPSPNHGPRRAGAAIDMLVLHYTGMRTAEEALERLCDPAAEVSAHYVIDEDGTLYRLVREDRRAWHAGRSFWRGERDINSRSIGIELVNPGHAFGYRPFPEAQMATLESLAAELVAHYHIPPLHVLGHSDVAPARKEDPGELFDWARLARAGIGAWPEPTADDSGPWTGGEAAALLEAIGYEPLPAPGTAWDGTAWDGTAGQVLTAFRRHWHPAALPAPLRPDAGDVCRLRALARIAAVA